MISIHDISIFSVLLPLISSLLLFRQRPQPLRILAVFFILAAAADFYSFITAYLRVNNMNGLHIYTIVECSMFLLFYRALFKKPFLKKLLLVLLAVFALSASYYSFFISNRFEFNSVTRFSESFLLTACGLYYFFTLWVSDDYVNLRRFPYFYINSAVLLYFMGNIFLFMLYKFVILPQQNGNIDFWIVHSILNIAANVLFCIGFLCNLPHRKSASSL